MTTEPPGEAPRWRPPHDPSTGDDRAPGPRQDAHPSQGVPSPPAVYSTYPSSSGYPGQGPRTGQPGQGGGYPAHGGYRGQEAGDPGPGYPGPGGYPGQVGGSVPTPYSNRGAPPPPYGDPPRPTAPLTPFPPAPPLRTDYAHWGRRAAAWLIDGIPSLAFSALATVGYVKVLIALFAVLNRSASTPDYGQVIPWFVAAAAVYVVALGWSIWDRWLLAGRTGQSLGKRVLKIRLLSEQTGQPIGALNAFARDLLHVLDGAAYVGYLWPLWDEKRQTFADKLMKTMVVDVSENAPLSIAVGPNRPGPERF